MKILSLKLPTAIKAEGLVEPPGLTVTVFAYYGHGIERDPDERVSKALDDFISTLELMQL